MFAKITLLSSALFFVAACAAVIFFGHVQDSDIASFRAALEQVKTSPDHNLSSSVHQVRQKVCKDIWLSEADGSRLHQRVESRSSLLSLVPTQNKLEVVEHLQGVRTTMQDRLYFENQLPMQQVRYFEAEEGTYSYSIQELVAKSVHLSLFRLPQHNLPQDLLKQRAFLSGIAEDVLFSIATSGPHFQAQRFKATFVPP